MKKIIRQFNKTKLLYKYIPGISPHPKLMQSNNHHKVLKTKTKNKIQERMEVK